MLGNRQKTLKNTQKCVKIDKKVQKQMKMCKNR